MAVQIPRVGFDARWITDRGSGVSVYARELLFRLLQIPAGIRYVPIFSSRSARDEIVDRLKGRATERFEALVLPHAPATVGGQSALYGMLKALKLDIFHSPEFVVPFGLLVGAQNCLPAVVVTIHDVIPLTVANACPRSLKSRLRFFYRFALGLTARRADAVLTVSEASGRELTRLLRIPRHRIHVVSNGVSPVFRPADTDNRKHRAEILYVGRQDPYKGLNTLIQAFAELRNRHGVDVRLVIAGSPDARYPEPVELAQSLGVDRDIDWLGYLSESELIAAYRRASVLALPSQFEGFGLPVLEAMACGTPVVCTRAGGLPEVAGEAADYVEPGNPGQLCSALLRVLTDPERALLLSRRGIARAALFSWERSAKETIEVYRVLLARRRSTFNAQTS